MLKRFFIITLVLLIVPVVAQAARTTTDWLLEEGLRHQGEGAVTWGNTTPVTIKTTITEGTNTFAITTDEVVTLVGDGGSSVAGTQPAINITVINASATTSMAGTITYDSDEMFTIIINGPTESAQTDTSVDCTAMTLTACIAAANALTWTDAAVTTTFAAGALLPDTSYTDYYEPTAITALAATAFTVAAASSKVLTPLAMGDATLFDTAALDFTDKTLAEFETTMEAMYGGSQITVTLADGLDTDLADGMNDVASLGATTYEAACAMPFTASGAILDVIEEDRYNTISAISYYADVDTSSTTGYLYIYDGTTLVYKTLIVDETWTQVTFPVPIVADNGEVLTVQLNATTAMTAGEIYVIGRID